MWSISSAVLVSMIFTSFPDSIFAFFFTAFALTVIGSIPLIALLKKLHITRRDEHDFSSLIAGREAKIGTPIMGGIIIVSVIAVLTTMFNWHRETTYVPIGVLLLSAALGGLDDLLNIFYTKTRPVRTLGKVWTLIRVHKNILARVWYVLLLPWYAYKRFFYLLGSHPGSGIQAHEKILVQFIIGCIIAWWLSFKLSWTSIWIPWHGSYDLGWMIVPLIIFLVMFMSNAVNITDGIDGLSAGTLLLSYSAFFIVALQHRNTDFIFLIAVTIGALLGYLLFNIKPARYQMGDVASLGMGVMLTAIAFALDRVVLLPIIGGIFVIEIVSVLIQVAWRVLFGHRLLAMAPLHHHLEITGWSEATIVMYAWAVASLFSMTAIWLSFH
ncbi:MAG: hypothetical protein HYV65_00220 [Candidatus Spechtbacteria bacterium]|nr:hypothetical protein [Candidatus Spechtbacteria bacterium]